MNLRTPLRCQQIDEARAAKDSGIARADRHANPAWKKAAYAVVLRFALRGKPFTADDIVESIPLKVSTHQPSALGPVFLRAAKAGVIYKTGRLVPTRLARRHRDLTEWKGVPEK